MLPATELLVGLVPPHASVPFAFAVACLALDSVCVPAVLGRRPPGNHKPASNTGASSTISRPIAVAGRPQGANQTHNKQRLRESCDSAGSRRFRHNPERSTCAAARAWALRMAAAGPPGGGYHARPGPGPRPAAPMQQARERAANPKGMDFAPAVIASLDVRGVSCSGTRCGDCACGRRGRRSSAPALWSFSKLHIFAAAFHRLPRRGRCTNRHRNSRRLRTLILASATSVACLFTETCGTTRRRRSPRVSCTGASAGTTGAQ